ncbi:MAG: type II toxin-antitoxin system VapC family toxin [Acidimicrobiia bacterium]|nr:type II toxin-antitoxin system VapC family toxin [Acidimicrobiia bacterium]
MSDAWLAALALETGSELVTTDRDFTRFPGLRMSHPLEG